MFFFLGACASTSTSGPEPEYNSSESALETYNRAMFEFNMQVNKNVLNPLAKGYKAITTQSIRNGVTNFFENLKEPASMLNNLLQGNLADSGTSVGRFAVNSTVGLLGTFDVASAWGIEKKETGFDQTLAQYCVPDGPFFMLPVIGPATPRYITGFVADGFASPTYWALINNDDSGVRAILWGAVGLKYLNIWAENLSMLENLEAGSVDYYTTIKLAFLQHREKFKNICAPTDTDGQTSVDYDFDFEEDF